jgi:hypothetical protein
MKLGWDNVNHFWNMWIIGYNNKKQDSFMSWLGMGDFGWQGLATALFSGLFLLVLLVAFQLLYRTHVSREPAQRIYQRFCRKLARIGVRKSQSEGASHFAQRAIRLHPELSEPINKITQLYNKIRYAEPEPSAKRTTTALREAVSRFHPQR